MIAEPAGKSKPPGVETGARETGMVQQDVTSIVQKFLDARPAAIIRLVAWRLPGAGRSNKRLPTGHLTRRVSDIVGSGIGYWLYA
ncbi:MAG: hypothetical protein A2498_13625 [Lentisphaerae bacterium RIFOXYC12_FULL_60_16]|nr:MAG: hypothetical protein A2498_13625 [Lentisphaerae bacterium RIFOXYC12_FULL_60_16]